jgi:hypothetical protein
MNYMYSFLLAASMAAAYTGLAAAQDLPCFHINPSTGTEGNLTLSELVESIEYIPLETTDKCLLGSISNFDISDNYILVLCRKTNGCYLFSRKTGKFLSTIGRRGEGPGEYLTPDNCLLDEKNGRAIVVARTGMEKDARMKYYDLRGKYIKDVKVENHAHPWYTNSRTMSNGRILMMYSNLSIEVPFTYEIWSGEAMRKQAVKPVHGDFPAGNYVLSPFFAYSYHNRNYVKSAIMNDTVYEIGSDNSFIPVFTMNNGNKEITFDDLRNSIKNPYDPSRINPYQMFETNDYFLLSYYSATKIMYYYFDKQRKQTFRFESKAGILNDYDGGPDFFPAAQYNNAYVAFYDAHTLVEQLSKPKKSPPTGTTAAVQAYDRMSRKLDAEDNPVVMVVKMK